MAYILLVIGFVLLIKGADYFVDGSSNIAGLLQVPSILIGLTIVAFGTSSPEATVSIIAALEGSADVALGNIVGSNIFNLTLVVGAAAILYPLTVQSETTKKEIPFTLLASGVLLVLISDIFLQGLSENSISRSDGIILLLFLSIFMYYIIETAMSSRSNGSNANPPNDVKWGKSILITILGLAAIIFGGQMVVTNGTEIAYALGMSETLVGLTIIAIGTSLPELVTSITAALKKESEIALGNIVGSNIFNILFVLGASSVITPLSVNNKIFADVYMMIILTILLLIFSRTNYRIGKREGIMLVLSYVIYMIFIILRN
ncbi:calcium/sodium antiporter [Virgibacillus sp. YIM 98842]|uniref:calcium/sodium antiporter n=1 Tax=Virgibacillus sp. YIM 98842 TaxID=2663533 RepID=UPI0013DB178E|nr:calcium/sodium antiporter [Virgibacillus sp. YIM 98842]